MLVYACVYAHSAEITSDKLWFVWFVWFGQQAPKGDRRVTEQPPKDSQFVTFRSVPAEFCYASIFPLNPGDHLRRLSSDVRFSGFSVALLSSAGCVGLQQPHILHGKPCKEWWWWWCTRPFSICLAQKAPNAARVQYKTVQAI
jgi:hypothetical protein